MEHQFQNNADWRYEFYFDKLYPMGIMSEYDKESSKLNIIKINKIFISHLNATYKGSNDRFQFVSKVNFDNLNVTQKIDYNDFFSFIVDGMIRNEYRQLIKEIIKFYTNGRIGIMPILNQWAYFEIELDDGRRIDDQQLFIIKSTEPAGIETNLINDKGEKLFVDIYAVPQIDLNGEFAGFQNVIPVVNERRTIYLERIEKERKIVNLDAEADRNRVIDHISKGLYLRLSYMLYSSRPGSKKCLAIISKILGYTLDWRQSRQIVGKNFDTYYSVYFVDFLKSVYLYALIVNKPNIESLPIQLIDVIGDAIVSNIKRAIGNTIQTDVIEDMIAIHSKWELFQHGSHTDNACYLSINKMKIISHSQMNLKLVFPVDSEGTVDKYVYYSLVQIFFEIFINHIKHSEGKSFNIWYRDNTLWFANVEIDNVNHIAFEEIGKFTLGNSQYGLISLEKELARHKVDYKVCKVDESFLQRITWDNNNTIFTT